MSEWEWSVSAMSARSEGASEVRPRRGSARLPLAPRPVGSTHTTRTPSSFPGSSSSPLLLSSSQHQHLSFTLYCYTPTSPLTAARFSLHSSFTASFPGAPPLA